MKIISFFFDKRRQSFVLVILFCILSVLLFFALPFTPKYVEEESYLADLQNLPVDPNGLFYDETDGFRPLYGGGLTITSPSGGTTTFSLNTGLFGYVHYGERYLYNTGIYTWLATGTPFVSGVYTMNITAPPGYTTSTLCPPQAGPYSTSTSGSVNIAPSVTSTYVRGGCDANPYYLTFDFTPSSSTQINNNYIPFARPPLCSGTNITGTAYIDADRNGIFDVGEVGVPDVVVEAFGSGGLLDACRTDSNGQYGLSVTPGTDVRLSVFNISTTSLEFGFSTPSSTPNVAFLQSPSSSVNVAFMRYATTNTPQIGDRVWNDLDADGVQDPGEPGISGVVIRLYTDELSSMLGQTTTTENGSYYFGTNTSTNLFTSISPYSNYRLVIPMEQAALSGFSTTTPDVGNDGVDDLDNFLDSDAIMGSGAFATSVVARISPYPENSRMVFNSMDFGFTGSSTPTAPNLSLSNTGTPTSTYSSSSVQFVLSYANAGDSAAASTYVSTTIPTGSIFESASSVGTWSCADGAVAGTTCTSTIGTVTVGGSGSVTLGVFVLGSFTGTLTNTSTIYDDGSDSNFSNNTASASVTVSATTTPSPTPPPPPPPAPSPSPSPSPSPTPSPSPSAGSVFVYKGGELTGSMSAPSCVTTHVVPVTMSSPEATSYLLSTEYPFTGAWIPFSGPTEVVDLLLPPSEGTYTIYGKFLSNRGRIGALYTQSVQLDYTNGCAPTFVQLHSPSESTESPVVSPVQAPSEPDQTDIDVSPVPAVAPPAPVDIPPAPPAPAVRPPAPIPQAVRVSSTEPSIFTPVEGNMCAFDCNTMSYDIYIVNPDGSERHMGGPNVRVVDYATDVQRLLYEDSNDIDKDYNDVVVEVSKECVEERVKIDMLYLEALWRHKIYFKLFQNGVEQNNFLLWQNSHKAVGDGKVIGGRTAPDCAPRSVEPEIPSSTIVDYTLSTKLARGSVGSTPVFVTKDTDSIRIASVAGDVMNVGVTGEGLAEQGVYLIDFTVNNTTYPLAYDQDTDSFSANIEVPEPGTYSGEVIIHYRDTTDTHSAVLESADRGVVYNGDTFTPMQNIGVTLYTAGVNGDIGEQWNGEAYGQQNPTVTDEDGTYAFLVPNGTYHIVLTGSEGKPVDVGEFVVTNNIVNQAVVYPSGNLEPINSFTSQGTRADTVSVTDLFTRTTEAVKVLYDHFLVWKNTPSVQFVTERVVVPTAVALPVLALAPAFGGTSVPLFYYIFLQPLLVLGRTKQKEWGTVYNSLTRQPIDLAVVRLVRADTKKIAQTRVTDIQGRYVFLAEPGEYFIEVLKEGFGPSEAIPADLLHDGPYVEVYHGERIAVEEGSVGLGYPIPLDPIGVERKTPARIVRQKRVRSLQHALSLGGLVVLMGSLIVKPMALSAVFVVLQIVLYLLFKKFVVPKKPRDWGHVYDAAGKKPLKGTVVRLFSTPYKKLVDTFVTNSKGQYAFLVGEQEYDITYEHAGYVPEAIKNMKIEAKEKGAAFIAENVSLQKDTSVPKKEESV